MQHSMSSHFLEDKDLKYTKITDDKSTSWPITLRLDSISIYMTHLQLVELINLLNSQFDSYMRGPNYGK